MDKCIRTQPLAPTVERRADGADALPTIIGYAAVFNSRAVLHSSPRLEIRETIRPGAFTRALAADQPDVVALFNHDENLLLGRTSSGTLRLAEDAHGLRVEMDLPPTTLGRDVAALAERGDIYGMSFAFLPTDQQGKAIATRTEAGRTIQEIDIRSARLFDVSLATKPAYRDTAIALRAQQHAEADELNRRWLAEGRLRLAQIRLAAFLPR